VRNDLLEDVVRRLATGERGHPAWSRDEIESWPSSRLVPTTRSWEARACAHKTLDARFQFLLAFRALLSDARLCRMLRCFLQTLYAICLFLQTSCSCVRPG